MAEAVGSYSIVSLTSKKFPSEFENVFVPRSQSPQQNIAAEKVLVTGADRRQRTDCGRDKYPGIGLLRMEFNETYFTGTATIIAKGSCVLTCAHNVVEYDVTTKEFVYATHAWFELRKNEVGSGSVLNKRYKVTKIAVYPLYFEDPTSGSGFDLALCWIHVPKDDHTVKELYSKYEMPIPLATAYAATSAAVVGFPGEHSGEKWGMESKVPKENIKDWIFGFDEKINEKEIFVYKFIDTSPGQSGSPVMGMKPSDVLGVHTGGSASLKKNWATAITSAKLQWIADSLGSPWSVSNDYKTLYLCD